MSYMTRLSKGMIIDIITQIHDTDCLDIWKSKILYKNSNSNEGGNYPVTDHSYNSH